MDVGTRGRGLTLHRGSKGRLPRETGFQKGVRRENIPGKENNVYKGREC